MRRSKKEIDADKKKTTRAEAKENIDYKCRRCAHAIFDQQWGEYKCKAHGIRLYNIDKIYECEEYKRSVRGD